MCRRCSECEHYSHHWMWSPQGSEDDMMPDYCCKHCNAIGDECGECHGDGCDPNPKPSERSGDPDPCPECGGEGVILVGGGDIVFSRDSVA